METLTQKNRTIIQYYIWIPTFIIELYLDDALVVLLVVGFKIGFTEELR